MKFVLISDLSIFGFTACPCLVIAMQIERVWHAVYLHQRGTTSHSGKLESFPLVFLCTGCKKKIWFCVKPQELDLIFLISSALGSSVLQCSFARNPPAYHVRVLPMAAAPVHAGRGSRPGMCSNRSGSSWMSPGWRFKISKSKLTLSLFMQPETRHQM